MKRAPRISFTSLGCPKALVDSERIITRLRAEGYELAREHADADVAIVNTCGFLDSAQAESLAAIGAALADNGKVVVTGCMGAEPEKITAAHPNVLAVTGPQQYESVIEAVHRAVPPQHDPYADLIPPQGIKLTPRHYAYLKISEGCNNRCTFCIIPQLRGDLVSRPAADVLREAERLVEAGVKELLVISQDTSAYGVDVKYAASQWKGETVRAKFVDLARALGEFGVWVRLHYVYPYPHVDDVIPLMADGKILPYLDIPFQHASPAVLKRMKRPAAQEETLSRIQRWRTICPALTIRSTFIVGFPGETEKDFSQLLDWLGEAELDRVGCFRYEPVAGRRGERSCRRNSRRRQRGALEAADGVTAGDFGETSETQGRRPRTRHHRRNQPAGIGSGHGQGPQQRRRAGDRRLRVCPQPPAATGRRDRDGQNRAGGCL